MPDVVHTDRNGQDNRFRVRVKVCGITRVEDAMAAAEAGVDAVGLVFYPDSRRVVSTTTAVEIITALPPFITTVGLFLDASVDAVSAVIDQVPLDLLQFHGSEQAAFCRRFKRPYIKAVPMRMNASEAKVRRYAREFRAARGLLLDSHGGGVIGGSGERFDWQLIPKNMSQSLILAGGLNPSNIIQAVREVRPYGVDVSSGVETAKGIKDAYLLNDFMQALAEA